MSSEPIDLNKQLERIELIKSAAAEAAGVSVDELFTRKLQKLKMYKYTAIYMMGAELTATEIQSLTGIRADTIRAAFKMTTKALEGCLESQQSVLEAITSRMNLIQKRLS